MVCLTESVINPELQANEICVASAFFAYALGFDASRWFLAGMHNVKSARGGQYINDVINCFMDGKVDASVPCGHAPYGGRPLSGV